MKQIESVAALEQQTTAEEENNPKKRKRHERQPGEPKRPASAYLLFVSDFRKTDEFKALEGSNTEKMQKAGEKWNSLSQDDKDVSPKGSLSFFPLLLTRKLKLAEGPNGDKNTVTRTQNNFLSTDVYSTFPYFLLSV